MIAAAIIKDVRDHMPVRAPEWWAAIMMFALGAWLARPVDSFGLSPSYKIMGEVASEDGWAFFLMMLSGARLCALVLNGTFKETRRWSPIVRAAAAGLSSMTWCAIAVMTAGANSAAPVTPVAAMVALGEFGLCLFVARQGGRAAQGAE